MYIKIQEKAKLDAYKYIFCIHFICLFVSPFLKPSALVQGRMRVKVLSISENHLKFKSDLLGTSVFHCDAQLLCWQCYVWKTEQIFFLLFSVLIHWSDATFQWLPSLKHYVWLCTGHHIVFLIMFRFYTAALTTTAF